MMPNVDTKLTARDVTCECCTGSKSRQEGPEHPHHHASISEVPVLQEGSSRGKEKEVIYVLDRSGHHLQTKTAPKVKEGDRNRKAVTQYYNDMCTRHGSDLTAIIVATSGVSFIQMYREGRPLSGSTVHFVDSHSKTIINIRGAVENVLGHVNSFLVNNDDNENFVAQAYRSLNQHPFGHEMDRERSRRKSKSQVGDPAVREHRVRAHSHADMFEQGQPRFLEVADKIVGLRMVDFQLISQVLDGLRKSNNQRITAKTLKEIVEMNSIVFELPQDVGQKLFTLANTIYAEWNKLNIRQKQIQPDANVTFFDALDSLNAKKTPRPALTPALGPNFAALPPLSDSASSESQQESIGDGQADMVDDHEESARPRAGHGGKQLKQLRQAVQVKRAMQVGREHSSHRGKSRQEESDENDGTGVARDSRRVAFDTPDDYDDDEGKVAPPTQNQSLTHQSSKQIRHQLVKKGQDAEDDQAGEDDDPEVSGKGGLRGMFESGVSMAGHLLVNAAVSLIHGVGRSEPRDEAGEKNNSQEVGRSESGSPEMGRPESSSSEVGRQTSDSQAGEENYDDEFEGEPVIGRIEHYIAPRDGGEGGHKVIIRRTKTRHLVDV